MVIRQRLDTHPYAQSNKHTYMLTGMSAAASCHRGDKGGATPSHGCVRLWAALRV